MQERLLEELEVDPDLVTEFFVFFARFEYALKRSGYHRGASKSPPEWRPALPDWKAFARDLNGKFDEERSKRLKGAVTYLENKPTKVQMVRRVSGMSELSWDCMPPKGKTQLEKLVESIKRTRNNLFHGGKFRHGPVKDVGRDRELLRSCLAVLHECLELSGRAEKRKLRDVKSYFFETG